ncbi:hypothetical protein [Neosynechococcus sphagnicola]|uniref:hypothetical protein n=1 Tax=Neosynechococcus sphagnicola TaxID=1501145 RepID=UPI001EF9D0DE|nr:hypothetical protein [Neosynechococcus sphagnicola]
MTDEATWLAIARLHGTDAHLDRQSQALMRRKLPPSQPTGTTTDPLTPILRQFETAMAVDTVRNEYLLHTQIHQWFVKVPLQDLTALNERIYAQLFLTPSSDPWLGLSNQDAFSALDRTGRP